MNHVVDRFVNVDDRYAENSIAMRLQPPGFSIVRLRLVTRPVHLYHEALGNTQEINEVGSDWDLPAKLIAAQLSTAKPRPHSPLSLGHVVAEISGLVGLGRAHGGRIDYQRGAANPGR
jgi:hypothetical protein